MITTLDMMALLALLAVLDLAVPFVPQDKDTCGAASLAMVLAYWGYPVPHHEVAAALMEPDLRDTPGSRLAAIAREHGLDAIAYEGDLLHVRDYLRRGRPLIVAWKVGRGHYHDVVVVGFDDERNEVLVNDPAEGNSRRVPAEVFERRWAGAGHWTLLVLPS